MISEGNGNLYVFLKKKVPSKAKKKTQNKQNKTKKPTLQCIIVIIKSNSENKRILHISKLVNTSLKSSIKVRLTSFS